MDSVESQSQSSNLTLNKQPTTKEDIPLINKRHKEPFLLR